MERIPLFALWMAGVSAVSAFAFLPPAHLAGPRVAKLDWNTRSLLSADINGDGLIDLAVINNERAKVELLIQENPDQAQEAAADDNSNWQPEFSDVPMDRHSLGIDVIGYCLAAGDFNGDGLVDLAYTGRPNPLTLRFQDDTHGWNQSKVFHLEDPSSRLETLRAVDLDRNGTDDLLVLTETECCVFLQSPEDGLQPPIHYPLADPAQGLCVLDADRDGLQDILYTAWGTPQPLRLRLNQGKGRLGPEMPFSISPPGTLVRSLTTPDGMDHLVWAQADSNTINIAHFENGTLPDDQLEMRVYGTRKSKTRTHYATGDINGDGRIDLVWASGTAPEILLFLQGETGVFLPPMSFPSFTEPSDLSTGDLDGDGLDELLICSKKEKSLGFSRFQNLRLTYPQPIPDLGHPLAVASADLDQDGLDEIICAIRENKERKLAILHRSNPNQTWERETYPLESLQTDPRAVKIADVNHDGFVDVMVFAMQEPLFFFMGSKTGSFTSLSESGDYQQGLVHNLAPSAVNLGDANGNGQAALLIAGEGFGRALRVDERGKLEVMDQFNARDANDRIDAIGAADIDGDGTREILLVHPDNEEIQVLRPNAQGVYVFDRSVATGPFDLVECAVLDLNRDRQVEVLLLAEDRFIHFPLQPQGLVLVTDTQFDTSLNDLEFNMLCLGDWNGDQVTDAALVDSTSSRILELWLAQSPLSWKDYLHFEVFEADPHYRGRKGSEAEPREMLSADVTGDQRQDLVLLVHDRILIYPQVP